MWLLQIFCCQIWLLSFKSEKNETHVKQIKVIVSAEMNVEQYVCRKVTITFNTNYSLSLV